jgi:hypothetical protein
LSQKRAIFRQFFTFLKAHSGATQLKKDEKMAEKSLFGPSDQIANKLLGVRGGVRSFKTPINSLSTKINEKLGKNRISVM